MIQNSYSHAINQLKFILARKSLSGTFQYTVKVHNLLKLFKSLNLIRRFYVTQGDKIRLYPSYSKRRRVNVQIKLYYKNKTPLRLGYQALRILHMSTGHSYFILETSKGLMTHHEALKLRIGGFLVCFIN